MTNRPSGTVYFSNHIISHQAFTPDHISYQLARFTSTLIVKIIMKKYLWIHSMRYIGYKYTAYVKVTVLYVAGFSFFVSGFRPERH